MQSMPHSKNGYTSPSDSMLTPLEVGQSIIQTPSQNSSNQLFVGVEENWASPGTLAQPVQSPANRSLHTTCCKFLCIGSTAHRLELVVVVQQNVHKNVFTCFRECKHSKPNS